MKHPPCCLLTYYKGKEVVFTEEQRQKKAQAHPELRSTDFINGRVKKAIESPNIIYPSLVNPKKRLVFYLEEYKINNKVKYTKVILEKRSDYFFVITAFRPTYTKIKEENKMKPILC